MTDLLTDKCQEKILQYVLKMMRRMQDDINANPDDKIYDDYLDLTDKYNEIADELIEREQKYQKAKLILKDAGLTDDALCIKIFKLIDSKTSELIGQNKGDFNIISYSFENGECNYVVGVQSGREHEKLQKAEKLLKENDIKFVKDKSMLKIKIDGTFDDWICVLSINGTLGIQFGEQDVKTNCAMPITVSTPSENKQVMRVMLVLRQLLNGQRSIK